MWEKRNTCMVRWQKLKESDNLDNLGADGSIISEWMLR
jgi:hypothetical protein